MNIPFMLPALFFLWNLIALFIMYRDKQRSRRGGDTDRTPEGLLFFLATAFGSH